MANSHAVQRRRQLHSALAHLRFAESLSPIARVGTSEALVATLEVASQTRHQVLSV